MKPIDLAGIPDRIMERLVHGNRSNISADGDYVNPLDTTDGLQNAMNHTSRRFVRAPWRGTNAATMLGKDITPLSGEYVVEVDALGKKVATIMERGITDNGELKHLQYAPAKDPLQSCVKPVGLFDFLTPPPHIPHILLERDGLESYLSQELLPWFQNTVGEASKHVTTMLKHPLKTGFDIVEEVWPYAYVLAVTGDPIRKMNEQTARVREGLPVDEEAVALVVEDAMRYVIGTPKRSQERSRIMKLADKILPKVLATISMSDWVDERLDTLALVKTGTHPVRNARRATSVVGAKFLPALNGFTIARALDARMYAGEYTTAQSMYNSFATNRNTTESDATKNERDFYTKVWAAVMRDPANSNLGYRMPIVGSPNLYKAFRKEVARLERIQKKGRTLNAEESDRLQMGRLLRDSAVAARMRVNGVPNENNNAITNLPDGVTSRPDPYNPGGIIIDIDHSPDSNFSENHPFATVDTFNQAVDALHAAEAQTYSSDTERNNAVNAVANQFEYTNGVELQKAIWDFVQNTGDGTLEGADQDVFARAVGYPDAAAMKAAHASSEPFQAQTVEAPSSDALMNDLEKQQWAEAAGYTNWHQLMQDFWSGKEPKNELARNIFAVIEPTIPGADVIRKANAAHSAQANS